MALWNHQCQAAPLIMTLHSLHDHRRLPRSARPASLYALTLWVGLGVCAALGCNGDGVVTTGGSESSTGEGSSTGESSTGESSTGESSTGESSTGSGSDYARECQPGDFVCDDWGCEQAPVVRSGWCYKPCTPGEIGGVDDECDEPERPYCSQVGLSMGGDFDCNGCAHICVSEAIDQCQASAEQCG